MALIKGAKRCFEWLQTKRAGDVVNRGDIEDAAQWSSVSLNTYFKKNKLAPFLLRLENDKVQVLLDGDEISAAWFEEVFTQKGPRHVSLTVQDRLRGEADSYILVEPLGRGAVGHVWSARRASSDLVELVAVKVMLPREDLLAQSRISNVRERFRREAVNGCALEHENIIPYLDAGEVQGNPFIVMELAEESVGQRLKRDGQMTAEDAAHVVVSVLDGLEYLHERNMAHRDVKPDNILFCDGPVVKIGDLGIVKWSDFDPIVVTAGTITRSSVQLGSWFSMAPEQQENPHDAGPPADIYALGVTWIQLLTGTTPSPQAVGAGKYQRPSEHDHVCNIIAQMLQYAPEDRPSLAEIRSVAAEVAG